MTIRRLSRGLVLSTVAVDLLTRYMVLNGRGRLWRRLALPQDWGLQHRRSANRLLDTAAALRGTLIKACQFASTRPDILPATYVQTLSMLQDRVPPHPWSEIAKAIKQLDPELDALEIVAGYIPRRYAVPITSSHP